jgi:hypothetical protein
MAGLRRKIVTAFSPYNYHNVVVNKNRHQHQKKYFHTLIRQDKPILVIRNLTRHRLKKKRSRNEICSGRRGIGEKERPSLELGLSGLQVLCITPLPEKIHERQWINHSVRAFMNMFIIEAILTEKFIIAVNLHTFAILDQQTRSIRHIPTISLLVFDEHWAFRLFAAEKVITFRNHIRLF